MRTKLSSLQRTLTSITSWKLTDLLFYLTARKVIEPSSYFDPHADKAEFLYCPWESVKQDNFNRSLDFMYEHGQELLTCAVRHHHEFRRSEIRLAFFDCTNTWFETPYDDLTWSINRLRREVRKRLEKEGKTEQDIEDYFDSAAFDAELKERLELSANDILRMRGPSKEGRFSQPLVSVALAIDQTGFPIDCRVFAGNLSEIKTVEPIIQSLKEKYSVKDIYFTADRGLNSAPSLTEIKKDGLGFVVAQSVHSLKKDVKAQMLELEGYRRYSCEGDSFIPSDEPAEQECSRFKVCAYTREVRAPLGDGSLTPSGRPRTCKCTLNCRIVFTFSPERRKRDLEELNNEIKRANKAVASGELMGNPYASGWRSIIATEKERAEGENKAKYRAVGLKEDVIKARRDVAGYYAVVFDHPEGISADNTLADEEVLSTYHRLVRIEECFCIMKSRFSIHPVYVWKAARITGHCYLCVLALMLLRELQFKLEDHGVHMSVDRICDALRQAAVGVSGDGTFKNISFFNLGIDEKIYLPQNSGKTRTQADENEIDDTGEAAERYYRQLEETGDDLDLILTAAGLRPLKIMSTMGDIKRDLSLQPVPNEKMVSPIKMGYLARAAAAAG